MSLTFWAGFGGWWNSFSCENLGVGEKKACRFASDCKIALLVDTNRFELFAIHQTLASHLAIVALCGLYPSCSRTPLCTDSGKPDRASELTRCGHRQPVLLRGRHTSNSRSN